MNKIDHIVDRTSSQRAGAGTPPPRSATGRGRADKRRTGSIAPYVFIGPAIVLLLAFAILPIVVAVVVSFTDMDIGGLADRNKIAGVGFENYTALLGDAEFWRAVRNTAFFVLVGVPTIVVVSLVIALGLARADTRLFRALRALYFLPAITAIVAISLIWGYLYNSQFGLLNHVLSGFGVEPVGWLTDPLLGRFSVAAVGVWRATGLNIIIFLAALQSVPKEYTEAAAIDGAGAWRRTISITIPTIRFAVLFVTVTTVINWLQFFDEPFVLNQGRPNAETTSVSLYLYEQGFKHNEFGFASAGSTVLLLFIVIVTGIQLKLSRSK